MESILDQSVRSTLAQDGGSSKEALQKATPNDISSYEYHWSRVSQSVGNSSSTDALTIQSSIAENYLSSHVAHKDAVKLTLSHLNIADTLSKTQFIHATHLLYTSVRSAQEAIFNSDDLWGDAPPATTHTHKKKLFIDKSRNNTQDGWVIGSMIAVADDKDDDDDDEDYHDVDEHVAAPSPQQEQQYYSPGPLESGLMNHSSLPSSRRRHSSPQQESSSDAISLEQPAVITNNNQKTKSRSTPSSSTPSSSSTAANAHEWKAFEDAFAQLKVNTSRDPQQHSTAATNVSWRPKDKPLLSLDKAGMVLGPSAVPGTKGLMPISPAQRLRCEAAFVSKGYAAAGGIVREEAYKIFKRAQLEDESMFMKLWTVCHGSSDDYIDRLMDDADDTTTTTTQNDTTNRLDHKGFTLFMHLLNAIMSGHKDIPSFLTDEQRMLLLGESTGFLTARPITNHHNNANIRGSSSSITLNTARLRAAIRASSSSLSSAGGNTNSNGNDGEEKSPLSTSSSRYQSAMSPVVNNNTTIGIDHNDECWSSDSEATLSDDDDDAESIASYSMFAGDGVLYTPRTTTRHVVQDIASTTKKESTRGVTIPTLNTAAITATIVENTTTTNAHNSQPVSTPRQGNNKAVFIPRLALPGIQAITAAVTSARGHPPPTAERIPDLVVVTEPKTSRIERAAWEEEAGVSHCALQLRLRTAALTQRKPVDHAYVSLTVRDPLGRLVELPLESHPGIYRAESAAVEFGDQALTLKTGLKNLPPGCRLFLELKQWKGDKKRMSTVAWSYVNVDMMVDSGSVLSRVRCGPMVLPLFKKPMDLTARKCKRLNSKGPGLHVFVRGLEQVVE